jgi:glycosyltransferase involved in cell wall biosynthesis
VNRFGAPTLRRGESADVLLLLEGTYPFVRGGVSAWVHDLVCGLPGLRFGLVFVGGSPERYDALRYELPPNVVHLEEHYLAGAPEPRSAVRRAGDPGLHRASQALHDALAAGRTSPLAAALEPVVASLLESPASVERDFLSSERAWETICERYAGGAAGESFLEYFWTVRSMHAPLFAMARAAAGVPVARAFHVVSTGYAGFLGMLLERARKRPLILTEHGIYTKERRIEILQARWIREEGGPVHDAAVAGPLRQLWIRFFEGIGRMTYASARPIVSLYEGNRARQIRDGAAPERTRVVPNGVDVARFARFRERSGSAVPHVVALIGRVVPIKDVKTFVRAVRSLRALLPGAEGWVVGPDDEDPGYAAECRDLATTLGVADAVKWLGFRDVGPLFPEIGVAVLTSISEAQPLVVLEGFAAGVPCVASDVGCCRELVEGASAADRELGHAGAIVGIADPDATARAAFELMTGEGRWEAARRAAIARVERHYDRATMIDRYRGIYDDALRMPWPA